jgi:hypothetical protein
MSSISSCFIVCSTFCSSSRICRKRITGHMWWCKRWMCLFQVNFYILFARTACNKCIMETIYLSDHV